MMSIDLFDEIVLTPGASGLTIASSDETTMLVPDDETNLVAQALNLVGREASAVITKRIPVGGGLGGGSADAAAVLRWARFVDYDRALQLGSDVPFCIGGGRARVRGFGEEIEALRHLDRSVVLCLVPLGVNTAAVYQVFDELDRSGTLRRGRNDLSHAAYLVEPRLERVAQELSVLSGAEVVVAGSGSTLFVEGTKAQHGLGGIDKLCLDGLECRLVECVSVKPEDIE
jgi:4-diphosphocytidyl-2-C-methyl-D-erythritol kinase